MKFPKQFPSIYRIITENSFLKNLRKFNLKSKNSHKFNKFYVFLSVILSIVVIGVLTILTSFVVFSFSQNFVKFQTISAQRSQITSKINFWNSIAQKYTGYPDAYFNIALLYYRLGDFRQSRSYLDKTLLLNPDYTNAKKLDLVLRSRSY